MKTTYDFICSHIVPDLILAMDEYIEKWIQDDVGVILSPKFEGDMGGVFYSYLAAYRALCEAGVEDAEKYIVEMRTKEVGR